MMELPPIFLDLILVGIVGEAMFLAVRLKGAGRSLLPPALFFLGSGFLLIFAVRAAMTQMGGEVVGLSLFVAGLLHVFCLRRVFSVFKERRGN